MRAAIRRATAWVVTATFVAGLVLPVFARSVVTDPDGACGPVLTLAHSTEQVESPLSAEGDHCALHHLWNAMTSASVSDRAQAAGPDTALLSIWRANSDRGYVSPISPSSPRGPPSHS